MQEQIKKRRICKLCTLDCRPESSLATPSVCSELRSIMLIEAQNRGFIPDRVIYNTMANEFNKRIASLANDAGRDVEFWTFADVKYHFNNCVEMLPRFETLKQFRQVKKLKQHMLTHEMFIVNEDGISVINNKALDTYLKLETKTSDLVKQYAALSKTDVSHANSVSLENAQNQKSMLSGLDTEETILASEGAELFSV